VASRLRQMLVENRIPPGAKLNERELCEQLNVSRTPLREAIKMLAAEGPGRTAAQPRRDCGGS
jgi:DNA-binding GntR family transcriptional regulator